MTKKCGGTCQQEKPIEEFDFKDKKKGTRRSYCTLCRKDMLKKYYKENTEYYKKKARARNSLIRRENYEKLYLYLQQHPCVDCGETDIVVLDFDHRDASLKTKAVTNFVRDTHSWASIMEEIAKCDVRCSNCHRRRTAKQFRWRRAAVDQE